MLIVGYNAASDTNMSTAFEGVQQAIGCRI